MSNVIRFLETMGGNSSAAAMGAAEYLAAVRALEVDPQCERALIARDATTLSELLGGRPQLWCSVFAPDEEEVPADAPLPDEPVQTPPDSE